MHGIKKSLKQRSKIIKSKVTVQFKTILQFTFISEKFYLEWIVGKCRKIESLAMLQFIIFFYVPSIS